MFFSKKLEAAWNARTPIWLHNGTKENLLFQLGLGLVLIGGMMARDAYQDRRIRRERELTA